MLCDGNVDADSMEKDNNNKEEKQKENENKEASDTATAEADKVAQLKAEVVKCEKKFAGQDHLHLKLLKAYATDHPTVKGSGLQLQLYKQQLTEATSVLQQELTEDVDLERERENLKEAPEAAKEMAKTSEVEVPLVRKPRKC
jgi:hypothetical protein